MSGHNTKLSSLLRGRIRSLDPLCQKGNSITGMKIGNIFFELPLHCQPHIILNLRANQRIQVIVSAKRANQVKIRTYGFGVIQSHVANDIAEDFSLSKPFPDIPCIKGNLCGKQRIFPVRLVK